ncbi:MAG: hypothetical protein IPL49_02235 [Saprospirales bacterium]|nr:hypothetical protein [Saprospirales bacterium]MBK8489735.1 hypothetical protein [Saprospirales bacterium]
MAKRVIKAADMPEIAKIPQVWDPVPEWLTLNKDILTRFAKLQVEFKIKELEIQKQKLEAFNKLLG